MAQNKRYTVADAFKYLSGTIRSWLILNAITNQSTLVNDIDLNNIRNAGYYFLNDNAYTNRPNNTKKGLLIAFNDESTDNACQIFLDYNTKKIFFRFKENGTFKAWSLLSLN